MVELIPMNKREFEMYLQYNMQEYAQDQEESRHAAHEAAEQEAETQYHQLLPQGLETPDHTLCMIFDPQRVKNVGVLWFDQRREQGEKQVFLNDIVIFEEFRRRGYARLAMQELEERARELGAISIGLHVSAQNEAARLLYDKLKYTVAEMNEYFSKKL
jgi:ribosomal protein S18 acetylase RimI-like enzyme